MTKLQKNKTKTKAKSPSILILEDEKYYSRVVKLKLKIEGYQVEVADNVNNFWKLLKTFKPDLVLLDLLLPQQNGFEVLRMVKKDPLLKKTIVIVYSSLSQSDDRAKALQLGAKDYFIKSELTLADLVAKIKNLI